MGAIKLPVTIKDDDCLEETGFLADADGLTLAYVFGDGKDAETATALNERPALIAERDGLKKKLADLLDHVDRETCTHEDTHRGGTIWTICGACGMKWADDEGGFVPYRDPPAVKAARAALRTGGK